MATHNKTTLLCYLRIAFTFKYLQNCSDKNMVCIEKYDPKLAPYAKPRWDMQIRSGKVVQCNEYIDELVQGRRNPGALAMELHISCTKPQIWSALRVLHQYFPWGVPSLIRIPSSLLDKHICCNKNATSNYPTWDHTSGCYPYRVRRFKISTKQTQRLVSCNNQMEFGVLLQIRIPLTHFMLFLV